MKTQSRTIKGVKVQYTIEYSKSKYYTNDFSKSGSKSGDLVSECDVLVTIEGVEYKGELKSVFTNKICKYTKSRFTKETFYFNGFEYPRNEKQLLIGLLN